MQPNNILPQSRGVFQVFIYGKAKWVEGGVSRWGRFKVTEELALI